nr:hypothetical protein [Edwardsiella ictaluri]
MFSKDKFSRMISLVALVMTCAPLPGGALMLRFSWHAILWAMALLVALFIRKTLSRARRQPFRLWPPDPFRRSVPPFSRVVLYLTRGFLFSGTFFQRVPLCLHRSHQHFGYYFA